MIKGEKISFAGQAAPNILSRNFGASKSQQAVTDVTSSRTGKKAYLSSVLDLFNREVAQPVGCDMEMVNTMLDGAFPPDREMLRCCTFQGWHYRMRSMERLKAQG